MPWAPKPPCRVVGCPHLQPCATHPPPRSRWDGRGTSAERGYGPEHRAWRLAVLMRDAFCVDPDRVHVGERRPSVSADHVVPIADGGARYDVANGQGLCMRCHATKTGREGQRRRG